MDEFGIETREGSPPELGGSESMPSAHVRSDEPDATWASALLAMTNWRESSSSVMWRVHSEVSLAIPIISIMPILVADPMVSAPWIEEEQ